MDNVSQQQNSTDTPKVNTPPQVKNSYKFLFFILLGIFVVLILAVGGYLFIQSRNVATVPEAVPTPTIAEMNVTSSPTVLNKDSGINLGAQTVSFARLNDEIIIQYKNKYFKESATSTLVEEAQGENVEGLTWYGIANPPVGEIFFDEVFSLRKITNTQKFFLVMRWQNGNPDNDDFSIFSYNPAKTPSIEKVSYYEEGEQNVPQLDKVSTDGSRISALLFSCWNCGGHAPETLLINTETLAVKRIGKVIDFVWTDTGSYTYKEYVPTECEGEYAGECAKDGDDLPLKSGSF
jgi:hypothetical protein